MTPEDWAAIQRAIQLEESGAPPAMQVNPATMPAHVAPPHLAPPPLTPEQQAYGAIAQDPRSFQAPPPPAPPEPPVRQGSTVVLDRPAPAPPPRRQGGHGAAAMFGLRGTNLPYEHMSPNPNYPELARLQGRLSDREAAGLEQAYHTIPGLQARLYRSQVDQGQRAGESELASMDYAASAQQQMLEAQRAAYEQADALEQRAQQQRAVYRQQYRAQLDSYQRATESLSREVVDPERYWKNKGTAGRVAAAIGVALGTVGSVLAGTPNHVMNFVQKEVENDLRAQQATLQNKRSGLDAQAGVLSMMRQYFTDEQQATEAARAHVYRNLATQTRMYGDAARLGIVKERAGLLADQLEDAAGDAELQFELHAKLLAQGVMVGQARPRDPWLHWDKDTRRRYVPGVGLLNREKDAQNLTDMRGKVRALRNDVARLRRLSRTAKSWSPADRTNAEKIARAIRFQLGGRWGMGAQGDREIGEMQDHVPNPAHIKSGIVDAEAGLAIIEQTLERNLLDYQSEMGAVPIVKRIGVDPKTKKPTEQYTYAPGHQQARQRGPYNFTPGPSRTTQDAQQSVADEHEANRRLLLRGGK